MESLARKLNQHGYPCQALDRKVKVELGGFGQFAYVKKDHQSGHYVVQDSLTIQIVALVLMLGSGLYGLVTHGSGISGAMAAISIGGLVHLIVIEVKTQPLKKTLEELSNSRLKEAENGHS